MAGDWIKVECVTPDKPEVDMMASQLNIDHDCVVGKLIRLWIWADQQSVSGNGMSVTEKMIDRITFQPGFGSALRLVKWLDGDDGALSLPNFEQHNGQTAKTRAATNRRVAKSRAKCNAPTVTETEQKALPEKRREEIENITNTTTVFIKSPLMIRVECLVKRKLSTKWSAKEKSALRKLNPTEEDIAFLESKKYADHPYRRQDLITLLNNWGGELDRMNATGTRDNSRKSILDS